MSKKLVYAAALAATSHFFATQVTAEVDPGAYLAGRQAAFGNDFEAAANYYTQALITDPSRPALLESAVTSHLALGNIDAAAPIADAMVGFGIESQTANLVRSVRNAQSGDWVAIFHALEQGEDIGPLIDGLAQAWAHMGLGEVAQAMDSFDAIAETQGLRSYGQFQKALALASVGDFESAEAILALSPESGVRHNRRSAIALAQILSQLERNPDAITLIDTVFGDVTDPRVDQMRADLDAGVTLPYDTVITPADGMAEAFFLVGGALRGETPNQYTLLFMRAAQALKPNDTEILLVVADLLSQLERYELSREAYAQVLPDDPAYLEAELGRANASSNAGNPDAAVEVLETLARNNPEIPTIFATLGDTLRRMEDIEGANAAYTKALALYPEDSPSLWFVHYTRAITFHQMDMWPEAEADFRAALSYRPEQPQVLNYLGYSLVERNEKLDEALDMIERAVAAQPDNGAIVDSLAWVYFQLGRYEEAVSPMERAATLEPVDPIVLDHLGDVYWAVGREIEAAFQWHRALSFDPEEDEANRIRRKLEVGLDAVLIEEGSEPIRVANDAD